MKKRIFTVCFAALLALASSITVFADDIPGEAGWRVTFDGRRMDSNFSTAKIDEQVGGLQPGDSIEFTINLKNNYNANVDWYMKNQVLEALEDAGKSAGGAYDYLLTYKDASGATTTLYSSEKFGGEGRYNGVGLKGATTTLDEYFYLDRLGKEDTGVVKLKVALDGETLVNSYQSTLAVLQMDFATELVSGGGSTTPGNPESLRPDRNAVKTGDETEIMRYIILMFGSGLLLLIGGMLLLSGRQEEETAETGGER